MADFAWRSNSNFSSIFGWTTNSKRIRLKGRVSTSFISPLVILFLPNPSIEMNNPEYCQGVIPLYMLAMSTVALSLFYVRMTLKESPKNFSASYGSGAVLFLVLGIAIFVRAFNVKTRGQVGVDDIYSDVFAHSKDMSKAEKTRLSALFSQAKYGDAPMSIYSSLASLSQAITGFGYGSNDPNSQTSNWKQWSEMRGIAQPNATGQLIDYTCSVFNRIRNAPVVPSTPPAS